MRIDPTSFIQKRFHSLSRFFSSKHPLIMSCRWTTVFGCFCTICKSPKMPDKIGVLLYKVKVLVWQSWGAPIHSWGKCLEKLGCSYTTLDIRQAKLGCCYFWKRWGKFGKRRAKFGFTDTKLGFGFSDTKSRLGPSSGKLGYSYTKLGFSSAKLGCS